MRWIEYQGEIIGACVDDVEFTMQDIYGSPTLHQMYHKELNRRHYEVLVREMDINRSGGDSVCVRNGDR